MVGEQRPAGRRHERRQTLEPLHRVGRGQGKRGTAYERVTPDAVPGRSRSLLDGVRRLTARSKA